MQPRVLVVATVLADTMGSGTAPAHLLVLPDSTLRRRSLDSYNRPLISPNNGRNYWRLAWNAPLENILLCPDWLLFGMDFVHEFERRT